MQCTPANSDSSLLINRGAFYVAIKIFWNYYMNNVDVSSEARFYVTKIRSFKVVIISNEFWIVK